MTTEGAPDRMLALLHESEHVRRLALRLCADAHGADDAVQDAYVAALRAAPPRAEGVRGWLSALLRNSVRQAGRAGRRRRQRELAVGADAAGDSAPAAAELVARAELHRRLCELVVALPEPQRGLVLAHYFEGEDTAGLAARHGLTADAVRAHLRRARAALRQQLEREPRQRRALLGLTASAPALTVGVGAATAVAAGIGMKKVLLGAAALLAVAFGSWVALGGRAAEIAAPGAVDGEAVAGALDPAAMASPETRSDNSRASVAAAGAASAAMPFAFELRGLHPAAPWTERLHVRLKGRDDVADQWLEQDVDEIPGADGVLRVLLPPWVRQHTRELRVYADAADYLPFDERRDGALPESGVFAIDVQVAAVLHGRVVDWRGEPVPAAQIAAYRAAAGRPLDGVLAVTTSAADGTYVLQVPPATPLFLVAAAMQEASLSGYRLVGRHGAITVLDAFRTDLLPAITSTRGWIGRSAEVADLVLPAAAAVAGTTRWHDGRPVVGARIGSIPQAQNATLQFGGRLALEEVDAGVWSPLVETVTDERGEFRLSGRAGQEIGCEVREIEGHLIDGVLGARVVAPGRVALTVPAPVRLRALVGGAVAAGATYCVDWQRQRGNADGEALLVVGALPTDSEPQVAIAEKGNLRSSPVPIDATMAGSVVELPLMAALARVQIEFDGPIPVRNARFDLLRPAGGPSQSWPLQRSDRDGPFAFWCEPGRYELVVRHSVGERNGKFLLQHRQDLEVPEVGIALRIPARFGGRIAALFPAADGHIPVGRCRILGPSGPVTDWRPLDQHGRVGPEELLVSGDYVIEADLGPDGLHRRAVSVTAREIADVVLRVQ